MTLDPLEVGSFLNILTLAPSLSVADPSTIVHLEDRDFFNLDSSSGISMGLVSVSSMSSL